MYAYESPEEITVVIENYEPVPADFSLTPDDPVTLEGGGFTEIECAFSSLTPGDVLSTSGQYVQGKTIAIYMYAGMLEDEEGNVIAFNVTNDHYEEDMAAVFGNYDPETLASFTVEVYIDPEVYGNAEPDTYTGYLNYDSIWNDDTDEAADGKSGSIGLTLTIPDNTTGGNGDSITDWKDLADAIFEVSDGETIVLTQDITFGEYDDSIGIAEDKDFTLDLNGKTVSANEQLNKLGELFIVDGKLTIIDSVGGGSLSSSRRYAVAVGTEGKVTLESGAIGGEPTAAAVYVQGGTFEMNGGSVTGGSTGVSIDADGQFTMSGGAISNCESSVNVNSADAAFILKGGEITGEITLSDGCITIGAALEETARYTVCTPSAGVFTSGLSGKGTAANFVSSYGYFGVVLNDSGEAMMVPKDSIVSYVERSWNGTAVVSETKNASAAPVPSDGGMTSGWYVLNGDVTRNGRVESISGDVNLILGDGYTLNVKGIYVPYGSTLTIYGQSAGTGKIISKPTSGGAAIGGGCSNSNALHGKGYNITINGGYVYAQAADGAGIGGGSQAEGIDIVINGGNVEATSNSGAGIGFGSNIVSTAGQGQNYHEVITINGGQVSASCTYVGDRGIALIYGSNDHINLTLVAYIYTGAKIMCDSSPNPTTVISGTNDVLQVNYIVIEPCTHDNATYEITAAAHKMKCTDCRTKFTAEPHTYGADGKCTVCRHQTNETLYTVTFAAGAGGGSMDPAYVPAGGAYKLPDCGFDQPQGGAFTGWSVAVGAAEAVSMGEGDEITVTADTTVTAQWESGEEVPAFENYSLTLSGEIGVNFFVSYPEDFDPDGSYMTFVLGDSRTETMEYDESKTSGGVRYFTCYINALELNETITAKYHYGDGSVIKTTYKAMDYIGYMKENCANYANSDELLALVKALQNYGYYLAQTDWSDNVEHTPVTAAADTGLTSRVDAARTAVDGKAMVKSLGDSGIDGDKVVYSLTLNAKTVINLFIEKTDGLEIKSASIGGMTLAVSTVTMDGKQYYMISSPSFGAGALETDFTFKVTTGTGEAQFTLSALSYVRSILNDDTYTNAEKYAITAIYEYAEAAKAYGTATGQI